jgi:hypothetical protein
MTTIKLCKWIVVMNLLFGCSSKDGNGESVHIVVIGTAVHLKSGAGVISDGEVYRLDGVELWDENILDKRVRVEGELFVEVLSPLPSLPLVDTSSIPPPPPQRVPNGFLLIIKKPKW